MKNVVEFYYLSVVSAALGVSQLPLKWTKPVINSVLTPAHAQTSQSSTPEPSTPEPTNFRGRTSASPLAHNNSLEQDSFIAKLTGLLMSDAHAGVQFPIIDSGDMSIQTTNNGADFTAKILYSGDDSSGDPFEAYYEASGTVGGPAVEMAVSASDCVYFFRKPSKALTVAVSSISSTGASYQVVSPSKTTEGELPVGSGSPSTSLPQNDENDCI